MGLQFLAVPLAGLAASVLGAGISAAGGLAGAAGGIIGGVASAAGGMLGGGESGNVQRDEDGDSGFERVSLGASPFGGTGGTSGRAGLPAVIPQTSLTSSDTSPSEGSSPQEVMMSIFKSIQSSLISIDSTLGQMLGLQTDALAMEAKSNTVEAFARAEGEEQEKKGFLERTTDRAKGIYNKAPNLFKILGLGALIIGFKLYREQIEGFLAGGLKGASDYFVRLKNAFSEDGMSGLIKEITISIGQLFNILLTSMMNASYSLVKAARKAIFPEQYGGEEDRYDTGEVIESTGSELVDSIFLTAAKLPIIGRGTTDEKFDKSLDKAKTMKVRSENRFDKDGDPIAIGDGLFDVDVLRDYRDLTKFSGGKIQWSVDLNDESIPYAERMEAKPVVQGKTYTLETLPDMAEVPPTNFYALEEDRSILTSMPVVSGSYDYFSIDEQLANAREQIASDLTKIEVGNDRYDGNILSRRARVEANQRIIARLEGDDANITPYSGGNSLTADFQNTKLNNSEQLVVLKQMLNELQNREMSNANGPPILIDAKNQSDNSVKTTAGGNSSNFQSSSDAEAYVKNLQFYGF